MHPLTIAQVEAPEGGKTSGDYYYRTLSPGLAMAGLEDIHVINFTNEHRSRERIIRQADVLILKNICDPDFLPLIQQRRAQGKITVYELADDLCAVEPWNPVYFFYRDRENQDLFKRLCHCCDALQFSVPELRRIYGYLNPVSVVFPNQMAALPPERALETPREIVVGWGGSHGHLQDMAEISGALVRWVSRKDKVRLHLMCSDPIWELFDALAPEKKKRFQTGSLEQYHRFLDTIHIGLAPLKDTAFNRSRSDVKFLEYAAHAAVPVVRLLEPYRSTVIDGETGFFFRDQEEMISILDGLSTDAERRFSVGKAAREYVAADRMEKDHAPERIEFYRGLVTALRGRVPGNGRNGLFAALRDMEDAETTGRHLRLHPSRFETLIHNGLVIRQVDKDRERAAVLFKQARDLEPGNYLPYLLSAFARVDPVGDLKKALSLNPFSLRAWIWLGEHFMKEKNPQDAMECFNSAAALFPDYEVPYLRALALLRAMGRREECAGLAGKIEELGRDLKG